MATTATMTETAVKERAEALYREDYAMDSVHMDTDAVEVLARVMGADMADCVNCGKDFSVVFVASKRLDVPDDIIVRLRYDRLFDAQRIGQANQRLLDVVHCSLDKLHTCTPAICDLPRGRSLLVYLELPHTITPEHSATVVSMLESFASVRPEKVRVVSRGDMPANIAHAMKALVDARAREKMSFKTIWRSPAALSAQDNGDK